MVIWKCTDVYRGIFRLGGVEKRGICWGNFPWRNLSWGNKIFMKGTQDFLALFKTMKNKYESTENKGEALKLKTNRNYYAYAGLTSS